MMHDGFAAEEERMVAVSVKASEWRVYLLSSVCQVSV
jgi:hypothetical protein